MVTGLSAAEENLTPLAPTTLLADLPLISSVDDATISVPEPMELAMTPPDMGVEDIILPQPPAINTLAPLNHRPSRSPEKRAEARKEKKDREKERSKDRDKEPGRKKSRKDSDKEDGRSKAKDSSRPHKGKDQQESVLEGEVKGPSGEDEVVVVGGRAAPQVRNQPNLREAAKAMPRIPKISQRHPSATGPSAPQSRDPRLMMLKPSQGESTNLSSLSFFSLFVPGAGHTHNLTKDVHSGLDVIGGGGKIGSALASEDDIQVVAAFRSNNARNNVGRSRNSHNNKRPHSPGNQG